ncbi:M56 family metallopeptidase [Nonomuraea africana]|uniref:Zn-dependent protease with chaperone function n=1 Tax=Nonomuraea africana TaxID=46171 RepID=A0ABR9KBK8_9ACTN|nr:M56 family metallopeptidase [Nonomuraea africana]MBE1559396.1 Zn-dependent protease with chaperone function [Nonomuraea africana]
MTDAALLAGYAVVAALVLARPLSAARWAERAPRLAIAMWLAACVSVAGSASLAVLTAAVPADAIGHGLADLLEICTMILTEGPGAGAWAALGVCGLVAVRLAACLAAVLMRAKRERGRHAAMLALLGRPDRALGAVVVDYAEPLVYCLPGRGAKTVITTAALRSLSGPQVAAVLAHERAHVRGRHHLVLAAGEAFARAFPFVPLFASARREVARLVELRADDVAASRHPRAQIAAALVGLATGRVPAFVMGAGGQSALTRVRRMLSPAAPLARGERVAGLAAVALLLGGPAVVAAAPAVSAFVAHHCHALMGR